MRHAAKVFVAFAVLLAVASAQPDGAEGEKTFLLSKLANKFHHLTVSRTLLIFSTSPELCNVVVYAQKL